MGSRPKIGIVIKDQNLKMVAEVILSEAGFEVESFQSISELCSYPAIETLSGLIIAGVKGDEDPIHLIVNTIKNNTSFPIIILSTFSDQISPDGRVRKYPASFSWKQVLDDLVGLINSGRTNERLAV